MRVTFLGHAGMYVETEGGTVLCDPWFNPAYFGSWFPFPRNDGLDPARCSSPDYLYVSHLHHDHFDPGWLAEHVDRNGEGAPAGLRARPPRAGVARDRLSRLRPHRAREAGAARRARGRDPGDDRTRGRPCRGLGPGARGLDRAACSTRTTPAPVTSTSSRRSGRSTRHFTQFSGAIWYPMVYDFPAEEKQAVGIRKRGELSDRAKWGAKQAPPLAQPPFDLQAARPTLLASTTQTGCAAALAGRSAR